MAATMAPTAATASGTRRRSLTSTKSPPRTTTAHRPTLLTAVDTTTTTTTTTLRERELPPSDIAARITQTRWNEAARAAPWRQRREPTSPQSSSDRRARTAAEPRPLTTFRRCTRWRRWAAVRFPRTGAPPERSETSKVAHKQNVAFFFCFSCVSWAHARQTQMIQWDNRLKKSLPTLHTHAHTTLLFFTDQRRAVEGRRTRAERVKLERGRGWCSSGASRQRIAVAAASARQCLPESGVPLSREPQVNSFCSSATTELSFDRIEHRCRLPSGGCKCMFVGHSHSPPEWRTVGVCSRQ